MITRLMKWVRGTPMEDKVTQYKIARRKRALARFKIMSYPEWCKARQLVPNPDTLQAYHLYEQRKKQEQASLTSK